MQSVPNIEQDFSINGNTTVSSFLSLIFQGGLTFTGKIEKLGLRGRQFCDDQKDGYQHSREVEFDKKDICLTNRVYFINSRSGLVVKFVLAMHEPRVRFTAATFILSSDVLLSFGHVFSTTALVSGIAVRAGNSFASATRLSGVSNIHTT
jgi:hypothetical protein